MARLQNSQALSLALHANPNWRSPPADRLHAPNRLQHILAAIWAVPRVGISLAVRSTAPSADLKRIAETSILMANRTRESNPAARRRDARAEVWT
jgi:hypothetical protein